MIVYAVDTGGEYIPIPESLRRYPTGSRSIYVNLTNRCTCACTFCLREMKEMAETSTLWLKEGEPAVEVVVKELETVPWELVGEVVFCGFGEPTMRLADIITLLKWVKANHPTVKTRLNTNGLSDLEYGRDTTPDFAGNILDTCSISLNASNAERYLELTRSKFGIKSYEAMLTFAQNMRKYVPDVVLTVVDHVEDEKEIELCQKICDERGVRLRVRPYEDK